MSDASHASAPRITPVHLTNHAEFDRVVLKPSLDVESTNMDGEMVKARFEKDADVEAL